MAALWRKCKRCRRLYRGKDGTGKFRCWFCPTRIKLQGIRRELAGPLEAAYIMGGIEAAQELATPGKKYPEGLGG